MSISLLASFLVPDDNLTCTVQFQQETINGWSVDLRQRCQTCGSEHRIQASRMRSETCHRKRWCHWDRDATPHRLLGQLNSTQTHNHTYSHRYRQTDRQTHYTGNDDVTETGMPLHTDYWVSWTLHRHIITHTVTDTHRQTDRHTTQETMTSLRQGCHSTQTTGSAELYTDTQSQLQSQIHTDRQTHYTGNDDVIETGMPLHTDYWVSWTLHRHTITHTVTDTHRQTDRHTTQETMTSLRQGCHFTQTTGSAELYTDTQSHIQSQIHTDRQTGIQSQCKVNLQQLWRQVFCSCRSEAVEQPSNWTATSWH